MQYEIHIDTDDDCTGMVADPRGVEGFSAISYKDGAYTWVPDHFFSSWRNICPTPGKFFIGKCSGLGVGSLARYSNDKQSLKIGRYVSAGFETMFMLSGFHEMRTISTCEFGSYDKEIFHVHQRELGEIIVKNDVWFGDECIIMADSIIENGCVIGARSLLPIGFRSEPFGIYVGSPAKLIRFRFSEKVMQALLDLAWWDMPYKWIKENNRAFLFDMTCDAAMDVLQELKESKEKWMNEADISAA